MRRRVQRVIDREEMIVLPDIAASIARARETDIRPNTPYVWISRTRAGTLDPPFPDPDLIVGRTRAWKLGTLLDWYEQFKAGQEGGN